MKRLRRDPVTRRLYVDYNPAPVKRERPHSRWMIDPDTGRRVARPQPAPPAFVIGVDLGQAADWTAIVALARDPQNPEGFTVPLIERVRGVAYPALVAGLMELLERPPLAGNHTLVVDATGVGRPVVDMMRQAGLDPLALTITGGARASVTGRQAVSVPKADLIEGLLVASQNGALRVAADLPHASTLTGELADLRRKTTAAGNQRYEAREGEHDDLVLALAMALWRANHARRGTTGGSLTVTTLAARPSEADRDRLRREIADVVR